MISCACRSPTSVGRSPPTSLHSESLPSENAPAPEKPVVMWQYGLQFMHLPVLAFGQRRFSMACPCSIMTIFSGEPRRSSSSAVKIPAGPAPTMTTSAFIRGSSFCAIGGFFRWVCAKRCCCAQQSTAKTPHVVRCFCCVCFSIWSGQRDSNSLPPPWQGGALPNELCPHFVNASVILPQNVDLSSLF